MYEIAGYLGAAVGAGFAFLQGRKTLMTGSVDGVSVFSWVATACSSALWINYGMAVRSLPQLLANLPWLPMLLILGRAFARHGKIPTTAAWLLPSMLLVAGYPLVAALPWVVLPLGVLIGQLTLLPQLAATIRSESIDGVSLGAWAAITLGSMCWVIYGVGTDKTPVTVTAALALGGNLANVIALTVKTRRAAVLHAGDSAHGR